MGKAKKTASETRKIRVHNNALHEIAEIINYIGIINNQPLNAIKVNLVIEETITKIGRNPFAFKECDEIPTKTKMYRKAVCSSWVIIYKITDMEIIILAVIHVARRPSKISVVRKLK